MSIVPTNVTATEWTEAELKKAEEMQPFLVAEIRRLRSVVAGIHKWESSNIQQRPPCWTLENSEWKTTDWACFDCKEQE